MSIESFKGALLTILLVTSLIALPSFIITITPQKAYADTPDNFAIIVLPDTQYYSQSYPWVFENQTGWIVDNRDANNIVFVTHMGDLVNTATSTSQWQNADNAMKILDNKVPYGILPGNHDLTDGGTNYSSYFPASRYENYAYWGGSYSNNKNDYQLFSAGGMNLIALSLQYNPPADVISWADNVLENHSDRRAIISTHSYLNLDGSLTDTGGTNIYNNVVVPNNNVFLVLCGHNHGEVIRSSSFDNNRIVYQILADYQDYDNGGNGYLRIMKFAPAENKIYVRTYSPYLNNYMTGSSSQFELTYPISPPVDSGWLYRRQITISPLNPENFQIKVVIPADIPKSDYPSIRFFENENSGALPYWIENCDNGSDTTVLENVAWVRRLENDDSTIYMYYHNPSATWPTGAGNNGDNVFLFWDDFGGGNGGQSALNTSKWGPTSHGIDVYATDLRIEDYDGGTADLIAHDPGHGMNTTEENTPRVVEFRIKDNLPNRGGVRLKGPSWNNGNPVEMWGIYASSGTNGNPELFGYNGSSNLWGSVVLQTNVWYIGNITFYGATKENIARSIYNGNDNSGYRQLVDSIGDWTDGTWYPGGSNWYFDTYQPAVWGSSSNNSMYYFDWFIVRKWAATEPSATFGPEQSIPGKPLLYSPPNGTVTTENTPTFEWTVGANADNHRLLVDNDSDFSSPEVNVLLGASDNSYTPSTPLAQDNYSWKVVALNDIGQNESSVWTFVVASIPSRPGEPALFSPLDGITTTDVTPTFEWTIGENAENHRLLVDNDPDFSSPEENVLLGASDNSYTLTMPLPSENYSWKVVAINAYGESESSVWTFVENVPAGASINLVQGWNLACFTAVGGSDTPTSIFAPLFYNTDYIMYFWNAPGGPYGLVDSTKILKDNTGYWVDMTTTAKIVSTTGTRPASESINLVIGWNLIGFPIVDGTTTPSKIFAPLFYNTDYIMYFWNAPGGPYGLVDSTKILKDNTGYWVDMITTNKVVTVP